MKKKFVKVMLLGALTFSTSVVLTGCKDYDDDIENLENKGTELTTQLSALQTALDATKSEAAAAKSAADAAKSAADTAKGAGDAAAVEAAEAKAAAEAAKAAAATAKAEAIEAAVAEVQKLMGSTASQEELETLAGQIEGIQSGLNTLTTDVDELKKFQTAVEVQLEALENLQEMLEGMDLSQIEDIAQIQSDLNNIKNNMLTEADLIEASGKIQAALGSEINTLAGVLANRLTSVTLVPKYYIDGIPTIDFRSVEYTPMTWDNATGKLKPVANAADVLVSNGETKALYRLNPHGITEEDIIGSEMAFVSNIALTRTETAKENKPIKADRFEIDPATNIMTVWASKTVTSSLNLPGNQIYTVSLKTPIAKKNLIEGENEAFVYSEYTRLAETTFLPQIAVSPYTCELPVNHYNDSIVLYNSAQSAKVDKEVNYKEGINLHTMVTGCYLAGTSHNLITTEELNSYGLEFRFEVAKGKYILGANNTNQQEFASVSQEGILTSKLPNGIADNEAAVDKEPIIRVMLVDKVNNNLVDQKYIKLKFSKEVQPDVELDEIATFERTLGCDLIEMSFTWDEMTNKVYGVMNEGTGMSKDDFHKIYTNFSFSGDGSATNHADAPVAGTEAITWELNVDDIGTIAPAVEKDYAINLTYNDPRGLYGDVTFSFKATIKVQLPAINGYYNQYWSVKEEVYTVFPVHYDPDKMGTGTISAVCEYYNNLMNGFTFSANNFIVKDLLPCSTWDMQFAKTSQPTGFRPDYVSVSEPDNSVGANIGGYNLVQGTSVNPAATLVWEDGLNAWSGDVSHNMANLTLDKNNGGKELVDRKVTIGVWAKINEHNTYEIKKYQLDIRRPVKIDAKLDDGAFYDGVYSGSVVTCAEAFTLTDFRDYTVAKITTNTTDEKKKYASELYQYYEVQEPTWDVANAKIGMKKVNGSLVVDDNLTAVNAIPLTEAYAQASITVDSNGDLVFKNNSGSNVEEACNIFIKATVTYGWGIAEEWVEIRLNPAQ